MTMVNTYNATALMFYAGVSDSGCAYVREFRENGVFVEAKTFAEPGERLQVELYLDCGDEIHIMNCVAQVMGTRVSGPGAIEGVDLEFVDLSEDAQKILKKMLLRLRAQTPTNILLIDDEEVDRMDAERIFRKHNLLHHLFLAHDAEHALDILRSEEHERLLEYPTTILLDIKMPRMDGFEFMRIVKADPRLKDLPIVLTTTSDTPADIEEAFKLGAEGYVVKPVNYRPLALSLKHDTPHLPADNASPESRDTGVAEGASSILCAAGTSVKRAAWLLLLSNMQQTEMVLTAKEALEKALRRINDERPYEAFIFAVELQPVNGFELVQNLRALKQYQTTPVIFLADKILSEGQMEYVKALNAHVIESHGRTGKDLSNTILEILHNEGSAAS